MTSPSKLVMIGAGYFARFQAEAWRRLPDANLTAVVDSIPGKAREFAAEFNIPNAYTSLDDALAHEQPAFVDIATRPESHLPLVQQATARGLHVICQKPMAPTWDECLAMVQACEAAGVRLLIHENWRWQPWYREVKRLLDAGHLGNPFQISFFWRTGDGRGSEPYQVQPYFRQMPRLLVYETLVHLLDTFRYLFGEISTVDCRNRCINPHIVGEDQSLIIVKFNDNRLGLIDANRHSGPAPAEVAMGTLIVESEDATLRVSPDGQLWLTERGKTEQRLPYDPPTTGYKGDSVLATQAHLLACLRAGQPSESDGRDYLHTVAVVEACYRSAQTGCAERPIVP
jgi:D-apiose dehydrogenase